MPEAADAIKELHRLTRTDADPRVRWRAQAVMLVEDGQTLTQVAQIFHTSAYRVSVWRARYEAEGREGLADRPRRGRAPKFGDEDRAWLRMALDQGPQTYGLPVTTWSIRDLQRVLQQERGLEVSIYTIHRELHAMGYRYRRPRHDLTHRQDADAVAAAKQVLDWLQKKRLLTPADSIWSMWMSVKSTPIPTWQRSGA